VTVPLTIMIRLRHGRYDAGAERPGDAEWPPHPARVFCAIAASVSEEADWAALRWLESQPAPQVHADPAARVRASRSSAYVVENATSVRGGNQNWPGRTNGIRSRAFAVPVTDSFAVVWPQADPPPEVLARLAGLACKVPYVGRSTSMAEVTVSGTIADRPESWAVYQAAPFGDPGAGWPLRVPYPGYADELEAAYREGRRSWEVARVLPYTVTDDLAGAADSGTSGQAAAVRGPFEDLMVWSLARPIVRIGGDQVVALACALRKAVIVRVPDPVPAQVSGHGAPGRPHVGFLALPDAGHEHADGHILGFALAIPRDLAPADLAQLVKAVILDPLSELRAARERVLALRYGADRHGLQPARWAAGRDGGTREWATVTPLMLDGHLRRGRDEASEVARSVVIAGYPQPERVEVSEAPLVEGAVWRPRPGTLPSGRPHRRLVHARVTFPVPVTGPMLAGSMRYLGLGLFMPLPPGPREPGHQRRTMTWEPATAAGRIRPREP
jgi:CRISPR-associated protein Csb2